MCYGALVEVRQFRDAAGREPVNDYLDARERAGETSVLRSYRRAHDLLSEFGTELQMPHARLIDHRDRLYELRFGAHRIAYAVVGENFVLLHAWRKRGQNLNQRELETARRRLAQLI